LLQIYHAQFCIEGGFGAIWAAFSRWRRNFFAGKLFVAVEGWGDRVVRKIFARRSLRQRVIALVAAYAIALANLLAGFGAAQAAAATQQDGVLCHSSVAAQPVPASDESNGKICVDYSCCTGCLAMAAAVSPPIPTVVLPHALSRRLTLLAHVVLASGTDFNVHRSRGPPLAS
jgi:hypothetical protein